MLNPAQPAPDSDDNTFENIQLPEDQDGLNAQPVVAIPSQTYLEMYGPRFDQIEITVAFKLDENALAPINGGSREQWLADLEEQMDKLSEKIDAIIQAESLSDKLQTLNLLKVFGMLTFTTDAKTVDTMHARLSALPEFDFMSDGTGGFAYIPENPPTFPVLWEKSSGFKPELMNCADPSRFVFEFHGNPGEIVNSLEAQLSAANLKGQVGVDYRAIAEGKAVITGSASEVMLLSKAKDLAQIVSTEPVFGESEFFNTDPDTGDQDLLG